MHLAVAQCDLLRIVQQEGSGGVVQKTRFGVVCPVGRARAAVIARAGPLRPAAQFDAHVLEEYVLHAVGRLAFDVHAVLAAAEDVDETHVAHDTDAAFAVPRHGADTDWLTAAPPGVVKAPRFHDHVAEAHILDVDAFAQPHCQPAMAGSG